MGYAPVTLAFALLLQQRHARTTPRYAAAGA
jgi:hypothetical protein